MEKPSKFTYLLCSNVLLQLWVSRILCKIFQGPTGMEKTYGQNTAYARFYTQVHFDNASPSTLKLG